MQLLKFLETHPTDWKELLSRAPYNLKITEQDNLVMFKYDMIASDFKLDIVKEARGAIFYHDENGSFEPLSVAMLKFFNAAEPYSDIDKIDWSSTRVLEKADGSLIKLAFNSHTDCFLLSTNGSIYAADAMTEFGISFGEVFIKTIGGLSTYENFLSQLDHEHTYFFELVSKYNKICVSYSEDRIYYLGRRNMRTLAEDAAIPDFFKDFNIFYPHEYSLSSYEECKRAVEELGENVEGFVCVDRNFTRVKIKTPWYIAMHKLRGNGPITPTHILSLYQNDALDDFVAAFPEYQEYVNKIILKLINLQEKTNIAYNCVKGFENRKDFALHAQSYIRPIQSFLFARLDNKTDCAQTYFKQMKPKALAELINIKEIDIK